MDSKCNFFCFNLFVACSNHSKDHCSLDVSNNKVVFSEDTIVMRNQVCFKSISYLKTNDNCWFEPERSAELQAADGLH